MNTFKKEKLVIFSVEQTGVTDEQNSARVDMMPKVLRTKNIPFKKVIGYYFGTKEFSFIIPLADLPSVFSFIKLFKQESILIVDEDRDCTLKFLNDDISNIRLGKLLNVTQDEAIKRDCYTYDYNNGNYFVTEL